MHVFYFHEIALPCQHCGRNRGIREYPHITGLGTLKSGSANASRKPVRSFIAMMKYPRGLSEFLLESRAKGLDGHVHCSLIGRVLKELL